MTNAHTDEASTTATTVGRRCRTATVALAVLVLLLGVLAGCSDSDDGCPLAEPYCGGDFPLNTKNTTKYGPPWTNVVTQFYPCYGPYALCYYADCTPGSDSSVSNCPCTTWYGLNFVEVSSILNLPVYEQTQEVCADDPDLCSIPNGAPVCATINHATFYETVPGVTAISDFSFQGFTPDAAIGTDCSDMPGLYSGCMTTACFPADDDMVNCVCPNADGPFQVGQRDVLCSILPETYSAAYSPGGGVPVPPTPPDIECFPDAGANVDNPIACPLYNDTTTLPPGSTVDCSKVCDEYASCQNDDGIELGYTCDATICTSQEKGLILDACFGLESCPISEIFKAEFAAGCSCCASQLCDCEANAATNDKVAELNAAQIAAGETPQCEINNTLCGTME